MKQKFKQRNEKGKRMKITMNMDVSRQTGATYTQENKLVNKNNQVDSSQKTVEVSLSEEQVRKSVVTDEELQCAIENVISSESGIYDVQQAEKMIDEVNKKILANANEAVLSQANQTPPMVTELTQ